MSDISRIDRLIYELKEIKKLHMKNVKLSEKDVFNMTAKGRDNHYTSLGWNAAERIRREHEAHALCVELGLAHRRESYEEITLYPDNWHKYNYKPREPFNER